MLPGHPDTSYRSLRRHFVSAVAGLFVVEAAGPFAAALPLGALAVRLHACVLAPVARGAGLSSGLQQDFGVHRNSVAYGTSALRLRTQTVFPVRLLCL